MCHIDDFLADLANANKPRNTIRAYRGDLIAFAAHHDGEVAALTAAPVRAFLGKIAGQAPSTRKRKRAAVASFCRWAVRHDLLDASPMDRIDPIEGPKTLPRPAGVGDIAAGCGGHFRPHLRTSGGPTRDRQTLGSATGGAKTHAQPVCQKSTGGAETGPQVGPFLGSGPNFVMPSAASGGRSDGLAGYRRVCPAM